MAIELSLAIQYATEAPTLSRAQFQQWARRALEAAHQADPLDIKGLQLTVRLVDQDEARQLNTDYRQRDYATNVLTFPYGTTPDGYLHADIVLCLPVLTQEAAEQGKTLDNHAAHLLIHGVLHALGYDHESDEAADVMESLEIQVLASFAIANPYQ